MDKKAKPNPSTLAVDVDLRLRVRELARQNEMTTLDLTNLLITFALDNCDLVKPKPRLELKQKQQPLPI